MSAWRGISTLGSSSALIQTATGYLVAMQMDHWLDPLAMPMDHSTFEPIDLSLDSIMQQAGVPMLYD
jgi:hypothetical protein